MRDYLSTSRCDASRCGDQWQFDESDLAGRMVDALGGFAIVGGLGPENVVNESLRIAVVEREPAGLNLHHDAMAGEEHVIGGGKREAIEQRLVRRQSFWCFKTLAVAAAENVGGNHQLITAHFG